MTLGALGLSKLPPSLLKPEMLALLSADGQVYAACRSCGWEHRADIIGQTSLARPRKLWSPGLARRQHPALAAEQ